jgi:hypothetical protein
MREVMGVDWMVEMAWKQQYGIETIDNTVIAVDLRPSIR